MRDGEEGNSDKGTTPRENRRLADDTKQRRIDELTAQLEALVSDTIRLRQAIRDTDDFSDVLSDLEKVIESADILERKVPVNKDKNRQPSIYCLQKLKDSADSWAVIHSPSGRIAIFNGRLVMHLSLSDAVIAMHSIARSPPTARRRLDKNH